MAENNFIKRLIKKWSTSKVLVERQSTSRKTNAVVEEVKACLNSCLIMFTFSKNNCIQKFHLLESTVDQKVLAKNVKKKVSNYNHFQKWKNMVKKM